MTSSAFRSLRALAAFTAAAGLATASLPTLDGRASRAGIAPLASLAPAPSPEERAAPSPRPAASGETLREEIRDLARKGLLDSALALCRRAIELDSADAWSRFMAGKLAPEGKAAAEQFKRVLESGKSGPEAEESRFRLGQYHYAAGKYHLAIPFFRDYLRMHPKGDWKEPTLYWMGSACLAFGQNRPDRIAYLDTGLVYLQKLLDASPPEKYYHALALEGMAKIRLAKGDAAGAWEVLKEAVDKAPEDERASILLLAAQLRRNADREEERRLLERLAKEHPQSPEVRHLRKLNGGSDPARWRAPVIPAVPKAVADSLAKLAAAAPAVAPAQGNPPATSAVPASIAPAQPASTPAPAVPATPPPSAAAAVTAPPASGGFTLQLGAFAQAGNAQGLIGELTRMGFTPEMAESSRGGKKIYQVRLGRFATAEEAQEYARVNLKPRKLLSQAVPAN